MSNIDDEANKVIWSLQNNKRTEEERNVFQPTGKKPLNKNLVYALSALGITFVLSYVLTYFSEDNTDFCFLIERYCFSSDENPMAFTLFIFMNLWILILGIGVAYLIGKKIGEAFKI